MSIPPQEAASTLHDIEHAQQHSAAAYRYLKASPHLLLWGVIWVVGYAVSYTRPKWNFLWIILTLFGFLGSFFIGRRARTRDSQASFGWRYGAALLAIFLFVCALFAILPPRSSLQIDAFFSLLIALWYVLLGIWTRGMRIALLGLALGILTVGGYFWLHQYFLLWMAGVGGGALILGGFWLRKV